MMIYIYCCLLVRATLLGVGWRGRCSSSLSSDKTDTVGFTPIIIYLYKLCINTLDVCFFLDSQTCLICTFTLGIRSVLEGFIFSFSMSSAFWRGFRSCRKMFTRSHVRWLICPLWFPWGSPLFPLGLVSTRSSVDSIFEIFVPYFTYFLGGSPKLSEGLLRSRERCPWKSSPAFCYCRPFEK